MNDLREITDFTNVLAFTDNGYVFKKDSHACKSLNKTLETEYKSVYRQSDQIKNKWKTDNISWDSEQFHVVTAKGKLLSFYNSEWGGVGTEP